MITTESSNANALRLAKLLLENKNILLAIGSRFLNDTANYYMNCKANVFTRVLPTYESITLSLIHI